MSSLIAREGDVLVVTYPEVKVPVAQYWTVGIGNLIYTRKLVEGDDVSVEYEKVYAFLKAKAERDGRDKLKAYFEEAKPKADAPKPAPKQPAPAGRAPGSIDAGSAAGSGSVPRQQVPPLPKPAGRS